MWLTVAPQQRLVSVVNIWTMNGLGLCINPAVRQISSGSNSSPARGALRTAEFLSDPA